MSPIELIDHLTVKKTPYKDIEIGKSISVFILNRWLSMSNDLIDIIDDLQDVTSRLNMEQVYKLYLDYLPQQKIYLRYVKAKKSTSYSKELINLIYKHFELSIKEIDLFLNLVQDEELNQFLVGLGYEKKQIKKILKKG